MDDLMVPLNVSLPRNNGNYLLSGESISCPFINNNKNEENELLLDHLLHLYNTDVISKEQYTKLCNFVKCEDVVVINALTSALHGNQKPIIDLIHSNFLNQVNDFCYLDTLPPLLDYEIILNEDIFPSMRETSSVFSYPVYHTSQFSSDDEYTLGAYSRESVEDLHGSSTSSENIQPTSVYTSMNSHPTHDYSRDTFLIPYYPFDTNMLSLSNPSESLLTYDYLALPQTTPALAVKKQTTEKKSEKRKHKTLSKKCRYDVRKTFADKRLRVKGRFLKKGDEELIRELVFLT